MIFYQKEKKLDSYGILRFTNRTADKAWNDQSEYFEKSPKTEKYFAPHNDDSKNIKKHPSKVREEELDLIEN